MIIPLVFAEGPWRLAMGLNRLALKDWLVFDDDYHHEIALKRELLAKRSSDVLAVMADAEPAAVELLRELLSHLPIHHADRFEASGHGLVVRASGERVWPHDDDPLRAAGLLVQEDFCLLAANEMGQYELRGAFLCFPSRWRLREKLGRPMAAIHTPVPGFAERLAGPADRFMAALQPGSPVWRANWSLTDVPDLFQPDTRTKPIELDPSDAGERLWLRVERQTLRRLECSRCVVFGIRTFVSPLTSVLEQPGLAAALAARLREMPEAMLRYKNLAQLRPPLLVWLDRAAAVADERAAALQ